MYANVVSQDTRTVERSGVVLRPEAHPQAACAAGSAASQETEARSEGEDPQVRERLRHVPHGDPAIRVHVEARGAELHVWLGLPVAAKAAGDALKAALLALQRDKALPMARLVCNGKVEFLAGGARVEATEDS